MDKEKLLKVLDMSEEEQWNFLYAHQKEFGFDLGNLQTPRIKQMFLADLAFRLRDEAMYYSGLHVALLDVHQKAEGPQDRKMEYGFWFLRAKPIHWIIAALIAKGEN